MSTRPTGKQVRLDPDVAAAVAKAAKANGRSLAAEVNHRLREPAEARPVQRATAGRARATAAPGPCMHPVGRRIANTCMACGVQVR